MARAARGGFDELREQARAARGLLDLGGGALDGLGAEELRPLFADVACTALVLCFSSLNEECWGVVTAALETNQTVTTLDLFGCRGARAVVGALGTNRTISMLVLSASHLGEEGGIAVAEAMLLNDTVTVLCLGSNNLGAAGLGAVADAMRINRTITFLDLSDNDMGADGGRALAEALAFNRSLVKLDLNGNRLGDDTARLLLGALDHNTTLRVIDLKDNNVSDALLQQIDAKLQANRRARLAERSTTEHWLAAQLHAFGVYLPELVQLAGEFICALDDGESLPDFDADHPAKRARHA